MSRTVRFSTAMRDYARRQIEHLGNADIVVGIPAYYSDESLAHVIRMNSQLQYFGSPALDHVDLNGFGVVNKRFRNVLYQLFHDCDLRCDFDGPLPERRVDARAS